MFGQTFIEFRPVAPLTSEYHRYVIYNPLVNIQKTIENGNINS